METCPECGELTPLGLEKERRLRRRATKAGVWRPAVSNPSFSLALFVFGLVLLIAAVLAFAYLVNAWVI
jgi:hypothetical protein